MTLQYDKPIEVTRAQYAACMNRASGFVAGRYDDGKFYIKLWRVKYRFYVTMILTQTR